MDKDSDDPAVVQMVDKDEAEWTDYLNFFEFVLYLQDRSKQLFKEDVDALFGYYLGCLKKHPSVVTYGTLLPGRAPAEIAPTVNCLRLVGGGFVRGHLRNLGDYPGIVLDEAGEKILGKIFWLPPEPEVLKRLDEYEEFDPAQPEGSLFLRRKWPVTQIDGSKKTCWIYVYNEHAHATRTVAPGDSTRSRTGRSR